MSMTPFQKKIPEQSMQSLASAVFNLPGGLLKRASLTYAICRNLNLGGSVPPQRWAETTYVSANYGNFLSGPLSLEARNWGLSM